jgi:transcriptional regulator with XRE-family HTH domain
LTLRALTAHVKRFLCVNRKKVVTVGLSVIYRDGMAENSLTERVRARLVELHRAKKFSQTKVAGRLNVHPSAVNRTLTSDKAITLDELETIADEAGTNAAELLAPPGTLKQLNADEAELLRFVRVWPVEVRDALLTFLRYFADEPPADVQTRNVHQFWRGMHAGDRMWVYGILQMVREGMLSPDLREGLADRLVDEQQKRQAARARRTRKERRRDQSS